MSQSSQGAKQTFARRIQTFDKTRTWKSCDEQYFCSDTWIIFEKLFLINDRWVVLLPDLDIRLRARVMRSWGFYRLRVMFLKHHYRILWIQFNFWWSYPNLNDQATRGPHVDVMVLPQVKHLYSESQEKPFEGWSDRLWSGCFVGNFHPLLEGKNASVKINFYQVFFTNQSLKVSVSVLL